MAKYHLELRIGEKGKAGPHFNYIAARGKYAAKRGVVHVESGNMPLWAVDNPCLYWEASDAFERANGTSYRELEVSLPRELPLTMQIDLLKKLAAEVCGQKHAFSFAIHHTTASDGGMNPHGHFEFSERIQDGIERDATTFFRRANKSAPEKGGCVKDASWQAITRGRQKYNAKACSRLLDIRAKWADMCNDALRAIDSDARVDHRSHKARGICLLPQPKVGAKSWYLYNRKGIKNERFKAYEEVIGCNNSIINESPEARLAGVKQRQIDAEQDLSVLEPVPKPNQSAILREIIENQKPVRRLAREIHHLEHVICPQAHRAMMKARERRDSGNNWLIRAFNRFYFGGDFNRMNEEYEKTRSEKTDKVIEREKMIERWRQQPDMIKMAKERYEELTDQHNDYMERKLFLESEVESATRHLDEMRSRAMGDLALQSEEASPSLRSNTSSEC